jgi:hypothetical protein
MNKEALLHDLIAAVARLLTVGAGAALIAQPWH